MEYCYIKLHFDSLFQLQNISDNDIINILDNMENKLVNVYSENDTFIFIRNVQSNKIIKYDKNAMKN